MRRFGYNLFFLILFFVGAGTGGCDDKAYDEKDMGQLATLTRVVMDIVSTEYMQNGAPAEISESEIKAIVVKNNTDFNELRLLDKYEMKMVSDGHQLGTVIWDPANGRKLIEDLRCTKKLDSAVWRTINYGSDFTLNWSLCQ